MTPSSPPYVTIEAPQIGLTTTCENCEAYTRTLHDGRHLVVFDPATNLIRQAWKPGTWQLATLYYGDRPVATFMASVPV